MVSEWKRVEISEVCGLIVDCVNKTAPVVDYSTPYKMIRTTNIRNGKLNLKEIKYVTEEIYDIWTRRSKVEIGDVLLTREAPLGEAAMHKTSDSIFLGQRIMQYRANPKLLDPNFLLYSFLGPDLQSQIHAHGGSGSVVDHIRVPDCLKFKINLPPLEIQQKIGQILSSLDDKIDLNTQMNHTLEAMARALFKSWFVDFDPVKANIEGRRMEGLRPEVQALFPSEFEDSPLGPVPLGWDVISFAETVDILGGGTPKTSIKEYWNGNILWYSVVDAPSETDIWLVDTEKKITEEGLLN